MYNEADKFELHLMPLSNYEFTENWFI